MGIQSTRTITRQQAIERIRLIRSLVRLRHYQALAMETCEESGRDIEAFVDEEFAKSDENVELWTDEMLGRQMDQPYYRMSYFDNYEVGDTAEP